MRRKAIKDEHALDWPPYEGRRDFLKGQRPLSNDLESRHGITAPIHCYPLFENAIRAKAGRSVAEHQRFVAELMSRNAAVAAGNPYAWFPTAWSPEEIETVGPDNRWVCFPYPKLMNAIMEVDLAAGCIVMADDEADRSVSRSSSASRWWAPPAVSTPGARPSGLRSRVRPPSPRPLQLGAVLNLINDRRREPLTVVGIGGHGGAGKSTLAALIAQAEPATAAVVAIDSFWNGSIFDLDRLDAEVFKPLLRGEQAEYDSWDWQARRPGERRIVAPTGLVIVEGVCALHERFRAVEDVRIWVDAPYEVRLHRGVERDGEAMRSTWIDVWMPNEDAYVRRDQPVESAHLIVDGSRDLR